MLLGIILFPLSLGFSLICIMWAFSITHNRPLGRADWAFILGWLQRLECFNGRASSLGLASGPANLFFKLIAVYLELSFFLIGGIRLDPQDELLYHLFTHLFP